MIRIFNFKPTVNFRPNVNVEFLLPSKVTKPTMWLLLGIALMSLSLLFRAKI